MSARVLAATIRRILQQLRADPRTVGLIVVVPALLLTLLYFVYDGGPVFDRIALTMLGILPMLVMFLVTSVAMLRERTSGTLERLLTTPMHRADLLAGYGIAFSLAAIVQSIVLVGVSAWGLDVTTEGPILWVLPVAAISAAVGVATGLFASAFARTEFQAVQFMPPVIGPQIYLCGLLVPHHAMPRALQLLADCLPMTYAVRALEAIGEQVSPAGDVLRNMLVLGAFALGALLLGALSMPRRTR